jgi:hypothetical protein
MKEKERLETNLKTQDFLQMQFFVLRGHANGDLQLQINPLLKSKENEKRQRKER